MRELEPVVVLTVAGGSSAGGPRQEVLGRRSLAGGPRQEVFGRRSSAGGPRQEVPGRRVLGKRLLGALVALRIGVRHVESHLLEMIIVRVRGVGTVVDDASQSCVTWGLIGPLGARLVLGLVLLSDARLLPLQGDPRQGGPW